MSRELILVPKAKYDRMLNDVKEIDTKDVSQTGGSVETDNISKLETDSGHKSYIKMKPRNFFKLENHKKKKKTEKVVKQKWLTFNL